MHIFVSIYAVKIHSVVFNSLLDFACLFCFVLVRFWFLFVLFCFILYLHVSFSGSEYMFLYIKTDKSTILNLEYTLDNRVQYVSLAQGSGLWVQKVSTGIQTLTPISYPSHAIFQKHLLFDFVNSSFAYNFFFWFCPRVSQPERFVRLLPTPCAWRWGVVTWGGACSTITKENTAAY